MVNYSYNGSTLFTGQVVEYLRGGETLDENKLDKYFGTEEDQFKNRLKQLKTYLIRGNAETREKEALEYTKGIRTSIRRNKYARIIVLVKGTYREIVLSIDNHVFLEILTL